jgi:hypothetical protein
VKCTTIDRLFRNLRKLVEVKSYTLNRALEDNVEGIMMRDA